MMFILFDLLCKFIGIIDFHWFMHQRVYHESASHKDKRNLEQLTHVERHAYFKIFLRIFDEFYQEA